jgi:prephenate dehydrogenase
MQVSIIGFGNFGKFISQHLSKKFDVIVNDIENKILGKNENGVKFVSLEDVCRSNIIILAVPMENFEETLHKIKNKLSAGTIVLDVCSLKLFSCELMKKILPNNLEIIGTHPLFGPQSAKNSIEGMKIALVNVCAKEKTFEKINDFCKNLGLKTIIPTAEEHDRQMATSQALTHFIGQVCKNINLQRVELSTKTFDDLMNIIEIIKNDTPKLFNNMQTMNPFAKEVRENFVDSAIEINTQLNSESGRK